MMRNSLLAGAIAALAAIVTTHAAPTSSCTGAQDDLTWAYQYAYPLYAYGLIAKPLPSFFIPNFLVHAQGLNTPGGVGVVRPNADTVYSIVMYDLSHADIAITIPEMPMDRYWGFPIVTPYGDTLATLGSIDQTPAGEYLLKYNSEGKWGMVTEEEEEEIPEGYKGLIHYPMAYGLTNSRVLANSSDEDQAYVAELNKGFKIRVLPRLTEPIAPYLNLSMFNETQYNDGHDQGDGFYQDVLRVAARLEPYCPTFVVEDRDWVGQRLQNAGFDGEKWDLPLGTNLTAAVQAANITSLELIASTSNNVGNNWTTLNDENIGIYHSEYEARYWVAAEFYLALTPDQCVYPSLQRDLDLSGDESVMVTFTEPPRINEGGFWSLTAYGPNQDLIENDLHRYSIGDQFDITFPDGTPVTVDSDQKSFQILLQPTDIEPPTNWTSNWLPINAGGGSITITLRWYGSEDYMSNGSYVHPQVEIVKPVTA